MKRLIPYRLQKLSKAIITTVMLSAVCFIRERRIRLSIDFPHSSWMLRYWPFIFVRQIYITASLLDTVSNIPSLARIIKS